MSKGILPGTFEGVTVLSLAEQYPGPYATMLMADLGADVILVERPAGGDPGRAFPPAFKAMARNKRSITLDMKKEEDKAHFRALAAKADVVIEGYRPGVMDRLGIGYKALSAINPGLIYASISGFGQTGPYRDRTAHDMSYQAVAGHLFDKLDEEDIVPPSVSYGDLAGAMFAAFSVVSALYAREKTGQGTAIDISMTDGLVSWMTVYLSAEMNGQKPFEILSEPGYGAFTCSDGNRLTLSVAHEDHFWRPLTGLLEMQDVEGLKGHERIAHAKELRARIAAKIGTEDLAYWHSAFDARGIPWSPLSSLKQVTQDAHFTARDLFTSVTAADGSAEHHVIQPIKFSAYDSGITRHAPALGEHNDEILAPLRSA